MQGHDDPSPKQVPQKPIQNQQLNSSMEARHSVSSHGSTDHRSPQSIHYNMWFQEQSVSEETNRSLGPLMPDTRTETQEAAGGLRGSETSDYIVVPKSLNSQKTWIHISSKDQIPRLSFRHAIEGPIKYHNLSGLKEADVYVGTCRPISKELCPEEPLDEQFPLLVDPLSVLGLQGDQEEVLMSDDAVSASPSPEPSDVFGVITAENLLGSGVRKRGINMTEGVPVPSSEHVAEIVGKQGCKIKALRAKTNTYIKTPVRGEEPIFIVTGRKEDVEMAKREILAAAEHFSVIRASRNKSSGIPGCAQGPPNLPGQTTIQVRVPYRVVGLVVGPKGATIKRIQQNTHTYIVTPSRDKEPIFEVSGMPENVDRAREEIEAHITMRTGAILDIHPDNDFHSNGTDVCMELMGGGPGNLWAKMSPLRRGSCVSRNESLSSSSGDSPYCGTTTCPDTPLRQALSGGFPPPVEHHCATPALSSEDCEFGFELPGLDLGTPAAVWSSFETTGGQLQNFTGCPLQRKYSGLSVSATSRLSPTLPESSIRLEHPLARRIHSDPIGGVPWLPAQGSLSSISSSTGYSSSSSLPGSISVASGSPTDSSSSEGQHKNSRDCVVCYESEVIAALVPCGHNLFCMECAIRICEGTLPECPACHSPASQAIRIFS
ncbi:hypothetical protein GDO86_000965 [Hymenochirus boettgeri]|uniref:RING-type domain-containing protein n=1 Tax=Hymenochirus boettgeri TaxID=247094 RepID=A0A8T2KG53_9PIPI|nr:hypothetical protein GDO86_000965 [Hymenochirus boettgeri]